MTLHEYLLSEGVPGIAGVDTRALTRRLRTGGVMMGAITTDETADQALARLRAAPTYGQTDLVKEVSTDEPYRWSEEGKKHIVVVDSGVKYNIMRILAARGCRVTALPSHATAEQILALAPDGVLFSPGPGDPAFLDYQVATVRSLIGRTPILASASATSSWAAPSGRRRSS
jgi:carbamoyl-phosphate synthase small subunit